MDKAITTALLIIAGMVATIFIFNSVYPAVGRSSAAMISMSDQINDRMKSRISVVNAANSADRKTVYIWVKNTGSTQITDVAKLDVFLGPDGNFQRIPYSADAGGSYPQWTYTIENSSEWGISATIKITVNYSVDPGAGTYFTKVVIPNGISDEFFFSM